MGRGTQRMLDAHERSNGRPAVSETDISTDYWQSRAIEARRLPSLASDTGLTSEPDHHFTFQELWPTIQTAGDRVSFSSEVLAGIIQQESSFTNWRVHNDGTGHGLLGLDDNGLLPGFEQWSGLRIGRGLNAVSIPVVPQITYAAIVLAKYAQTYGDSYAAARAWHRGQGAMNDALGQAYEQLIRKHVADLFGGGAPPQPPVSSYETIARYVTDPNGPVLASLQTRVQNLRTEAQEVQNVINEILRNRPGG
jgi:hypothetical protein